MYEFNEAQKCMKAIRAIEVAQKFSVTCLPDPNLTAMEDSRQKLLVVAADLLSAAIRQIENQIHR